MLKDQEQMHNIGTRSSIHVKCPMHTTCALGDKMEDESPGAGDLNHEHE